MDEEEKTRDVRRTFYLASAVFLMVDDIRAVFREAGVEPSREMSDRIQQYVVRHLELAWNDGALREADLRTALATEQVARKRLQAQLQDALRTISRLRVEE